MSSRARAARARTPREGLRTTGADDRLRPGRDKAAVQQFGVGGRARVAAIHAADDLRDQGIAAGALFKPSLGGWIVQIYPGGIQR